MAHYFLSMKKYELNENFEQNISHNSGARTTVVIYDERAFRCGELPKYTEQIKIIDT